MAEQAKAKQAKADGQGDQGAQAPVPEGVPIQEHVTALLAEQERQGERLASLVLVIEELVPRVEALERHLPQIQTSVQEGLLSVGQQLSERLSGLDARLGASVGGASEEQLAALAAEVAWLRVCVTTLSTANGVRLPLPPDRAPVLDARQEEADGIVVQGMDGATVGPGVTFGS